MKALLYYGARDIRYEDFAEPTIVEPTDAIVRVERSGICGSDLHIYHGQGFSPDTAFCVGHEAVGEVVEVGAAVRRRTVGERVMISAAVGCGKCAKCLGGHVARCETRHGRLLRTERRAAGMPGRLRARADGRLQRRAHPGRPHATTRR